VEQELLTRPEHLSSPLVFGKVCVARSLVFCVVFYRSLSVLFHLTIVLSVLQFTASDYPFGILKYTTYLLGTHHEVKYTTYLLGTHH
jgi:hypothetical protein